KIDENKDIPLQLIEKMSEYVSFFEQNGFYNTVLSIKDSDPLITLKTYELLSENFSYPLHIGVTESGINEIGTIRSSAILAPLLLKGIGSTIRISLTSPRINEIKACKRLLHDLNLYPNYPTLISCPLCGRSMVKSNKELATKVLKYLEDNNINIKVAIMGCVVNGINEGKNATIGLAGTKNSYILFKNGQKIREIKEKDVFNEFKKELDLYKN
ncbi:MAG: flavodoxin-dependent (E)-4-hydroxy-3-methylbut-2-enyl-diphosphate synthase, partial [Mollicutes bacterium]|nr:flavodoxin-dependent (E)-4-hydroxy-3-methylbut-2-enyl-diphosphate synthase [Mollicutes bacterium]